MFSLQVKQGSWPYQAPFQKGSTCTQRTPQDELDTLQEQKIIVPLGVHDTLEWCNSFVLVSKANSKVQFCLDTARLNKMWIRPLHKDHTLNDILPRLAGVKYLTLIDASSGHHNLKLDNHHMSCYRSIKLLPMSIFSIDHKFLMLLVSIYWGISFFPEKDCNSFLI